MTKKRLLRDDGASLVAGMKLTEAPILQTKRLYLRPYRLEDFEPFAVLYQSERSKYMDGPIDRDRAWTLFAAGAGRWLLLGYGPWAIERKECGQCIGIVSLNPPMRNTEKELGWALWEGFTGQGYAWEAAQRAFSFAITELGWTDFVSYISAPNTSSIKLAERLGAICDSEASATQPDDTLAYRYDALTRQ